MDRNTPARVPCWQVFEPKVQGGRLVASSGFSVRAEHAHQNQRKLPSTKCWVKALLPITYTAGVCRRNLSALVRHNFLPRWDCRSRLTSGGQPIDAGIFFRWCLLTSPTHPPKGNQRQPIYHPTIESISLTDVTNFELNPNIWFCTPNIHWRYSRRP